MQYKSQAVAKPYFIAAIGLFGGEAESIAHAVRLRCDDVDAVVAVEDVEPPGRLGAD